MGFFCLLSQIKVLCLPLISECLFRKVIEFRLILARISSADWWSGGAYHSDRIGFVKTCVINFKGSWDDHLPHIEFTYNNSYYSSIQMAPYEALYGRRCRSPVVWFEVDKVAMTRPYSVHDATEKLQLIRDRLKRT